MRDRIILHVDINNFYASAALLYNPDLKGKNFAVCGDPDKRHGVILAKNDSAKKLGVKTGETLIEARRKVKDLYAIPPDFQKYTFLSQQAIRLYKEYTPNVESFGLDECWLDVTETAHLYGGGEKMAEEIRRRMKNEVGLTVSIGVSFTKVFAKLGSDMKKPDAVTYIPRDQYKNIVWNLPAEYMLYVGRSSTERLREMGIKTIGDLANCDVVQLDFAFGKNGEKIYRMANGTDDDPVGEANVMYFPESVSNGTTAETDITKISEARSLIYSLSEVIAFRLRRYGLVATGVSIWIRNKDLETISRQKVIEQATDDAKAIADNATDLLKKTHKFGIDKPIRMLTVGTYGLMFPNERAEQESLFNDNNSEKTDSINEKLDNLRQKYGYGILKRGVEIQTDYSVDVKDIENGYIPFDRNSAKRKDPFDTL